MRKERILMADGRRYIIFYTFDDEDDMYMEREEESEEIFRPPTNFVLASLRRSERSEE